MAIALHIPLSREVFGPHLELTCSVNMTVADSVTLRVQRSGPTVFVDVGPLFKPTLFSTH